MEIPLSILEVGDPVVRRSQMIGGGALLLDPLDVTAVRTGLIAIDGDTALRDRLS